MKPVIRNLMIVFCVLGAGTLSAADWSQWRGPNFDGSTSEEGVPAQFSKTENVKWSVELPGPSAATPIVHGERVFVSSTDARRRSLKALCFDRESGKLLWEKDAGPGYSRDNRSNYASPSPAADGDLVVFFYGTGDLMTFDLEGNLLWSRNLQKDYGEFAFLWTFSTSPLLYEGRLYMQVLQRDTPVSGRGFEDKPNLSYLLALDPKTGKELFRHVRPSEAKQESLEAFSTPIPHRSHGRTEILIAGGDDLSGHDPQTGKELWRWGTWNPDRISHWRLVPSPVAGEGVILACAPKGSPIYAVKAGLKGELEDTALAWVSEDRAVSSDVSTPLFYKNHFYVLNSDRKTLSKIEPKSGRVVWTGDLDSRAKLESSPTGAGDKIYMMNHRGEVFVCGAGDKFEVLHQVDFGGEEDDEDLRSSIPAAYGNLYVRTGRKLYCIGN